MLQILLSYDKSGKRYFFPVEILKQTLKLKDEDIKKLEAAIKKEIQKL